MYGALPSTLYGQSQVNYLLFQILEVAARAKSRIQRMAVQLYKKLVFYTMYGTSAKKHIRMTPPAPWFFEIVWKNLIFYEGFGEGLEKCPWERGRGEGKPSPQEGLTRTTKGRRIWFKGA